MAATLREDAALHRLWYDLRNQSLFDEALRADAQEIDQSLERMIWRIVSKYAELSRTPVAVTPRWPTRCSTGCSSTHSSATWPATPPPPAISSRTCPASWNH